jgi:hypothetical protein
MANSPAGKQKSKTELLQSLLAVAIRNGSKHGESLDEVEKTCRFVAAAFYYRDFSSVENILQRENDSVVVRAVNQAMRRAGMRGAE